MATQQHHILPWIAYKSIQLHQIQSVYDLYNKVIRTPDCVDGGFSLTLQEFYRIVTSEQLHVAKSLFETFQITSHDPPRIDLFEFLCTTTLLCNAPLTEKTKFLFSLVDLSQKDEITKDELGAIIASVCSGASKVGLIGRDVSPLSVVTDRQTFSYAEFHQWTVTAADARGILNRVSLGYRLRDFLSHFNTVLDEKWHQVYNTPYRLVKKSFEDPSFTKSRENVVVTVGPIVGNVTATSASIMLHCRNQQSLTCVIYDVHKTLLAYKTIASTSSSAVVFDFEDALEPQTRYSYGIVGINVSQQQSLVGAFTTASYYIQDTEVLLVPSSVKEISDRHRRHIPDTSRVYIHDSIINFPSSLVKLILNELKANTEISTALAKESIQQYIYQQLALLDASKECHYILPPHDDTNHFDQHCINSFSTEILQQFESLVQEVWYESYSQTLWKQDNTYLTLLQDHGLAILNLMSSDKYAIQEALDNITSTTATLCVILPDRLLESEVVSPEKSHLVDTLLAWKQPQNNDDDEEYIERNVILAVFVSNSLDGITAMSSTVTSCTDDSVILFHEAVLVTSSLLGENDISSERFTYQQYLSVQSTNVARHTLHTVSFRTSEEELAAALVPIIIDDKDNIIDHQQSVQVVVGPIIGQVCHNKAIILLEGSSAKVMLDIIATDEVTLETVINSVTVYNQPTRVELLNLMGGKRYRISFDPNVVTNASSVSHGIIQTPPPCTPSSLSLLALSRENNNESVNLQNAVLDSHLTSHREIPYDVTLHLGGIVTPDLIKSSVILNRMMIRTDKEKIRQTMRRAYRTAWNLPENKLILGRGSHLMFPALCDVFGNDVVPWSNNNESAFPQDTILTEVASEVAQEYSQVLWEEDQSIHPHIKVFVISEYLSVVSFDKVEINTVKDLFTNVIKTQNVIVVSSNSPFISGSLSIADYQKAYGKGNSRLLSHWPMRLSNDVLCKVLRIFIQWKENNNNLVILAADTESNTGYSTTITNGSTEIQQVVLGVGRNSGNGSCIPSGTIDGSSIEYKHHQYNNEEETNSKPIEYATIRCTSTKCIVERNKTASSRIVIGPIVGKVSCTEARVLLEIVSDNEEEEEYIECRLVNTKTSAVTSLKEKISTVLVTSREDFNSRPFVFNFTSLAPDTTYRIEFTRVDTRTVSYLTTLPKRPLRTLLVFVADQCSFDSHNNMITSRPHNANSSDDDQKSNNNSPWSSIQSTECSKLFLSATVNTIFHLGGQVDLSQAFTSSELTGLVKRLLASSRNNRYYDNEEEESIDDVISSVVEPKLRNIYRIMWNNTSLSSVLRNVSSVMLFSERDLFFNIDVIKELVDEEEQREAIVTVSQALRTCAKKVWADYQNQLGTSSGGLHSTHVFGQCTVITLCLNTPILGTNSTSSRPSSTSSSSRPNSRSKTPGGGSNTSAFSSLLSTVVTTSGSSHHSSATLSDTVMFEQSAWKVLSSVLSNTNSCSSIIIALSLNILRKEIVTDVVAGPDVVTFFEKIFESIEEDQSVTIVCRDDDSHSTTYVISDSLRLADNNISIKIIVIGSSISNSSAEIVESINERFSVTKSERSITNHQSYVKLDVMQDPTFTDVSTAFVTLTETQNVQVIVGPVLGTFTMIEDADENLPTCSVKILVEVNQDATLCCVVTDVMLNTESRFDADFRRNVPHTFEITNLILERRYVYYIEGLNDDSQEDHEYYFHTPSASNNSTITTLVAVNDDNPVQLPLDYKNDNIIHPWEELSRYASVPWTGLHLMLHLGGQVSSVSTRVYEQCMTFLESNDNDNRYETILERIRQEYRDIWNMKYTKSVLACTSHIMLLSSLDTRNGFNRRISKDLKDEMFEKAAYQAYLEYQGALSPLYYSVGNDDTIAITVLDIRSDANVVNSTSETCGGRLKQPISEFPLLSDEQWKDFESILKKKSVRALVVCTELPITDVSTEEENDSDIRENWTDCPRQLNELLSILLRWRGRTPGRIVQLVSGTGRTGSSFNTRISSLEDHSMIPSMTVGPVTSKPQKLSTPLKGSCTNQFEFTHTATTEVKRCFGLIDIQVSKKKEKGKKPTSSSTVTTSGSIDAEIICL